MISWSRGGVLRNAAARHGSRALACVPLCLLYGALVTVQRATVGGGRAACSVQAISI